MPKILNIYLSLIPAPYIISQIFKNFFLFENYQKFINFRSSRKSKTFENFLYNPSNKCPMAKVSKIMLTNVPTLKKEAKIEDAARLLAQSSSGCVVIVENKAPIGIVTELDFVRNIVSGKKNLKEPVGKIMTSPVTFMAPSMKLDEALKIIDTKKFRKYPVGEKKRRCECDKRQFKVSQEHTKRCAGAFCPVRVFCLCALQVSVQISAFWCLKW